MNEHQTSITVRFNEVDSYEVAWHGHYVVWMEIGRNALAGRFGLDARQLGELGYLAPVIDLQLKYRRPARYNEELRICTIARRSETATLEFRCRITADDGTVCASGRTIHALTDRDGTLQYRLPAVIAERLEHLFTWQETP